MSKKDNIEETNTEEVKVEAEKVLEPFKYGIAPNLVVNMVRENRVYKFEMPIGAHLYECEEACKECLNIVIKMKEEAEIKAKEEEKKAKEKLENFAEDAKEE